MNIRLLHSSDIQSLSEALAELQLLKRYGLSAERLAADLNTALRQGDDLIVSVEDDHASGLAWFLKSGTFATGGYLKLLAVASNAQQKGTGASLLAAFEAAVSIKCRNAFLLVSDFNAGAQRFYERHGYIKAGSLQGLILPDVAEIIFWKRLR